MCSHKESIYGANWLLLQSSIFLVCVCVCVNRVFINSLVNRTPPLSCLSAANFTAEDDFMSRKTSGDK